MTREAEASALKRAVLIRLTVRLHKSRLISLVGERQKRYGGGIITLFRAASRGPTHRFPPSAPGGSRINIHRCAYVRTAWLSGEEPLLFHKPGRAGSDRLGATFFRTLFSSPPPLPPCPPPLLFAFPLAASSLVFVSFCHLA